MRRAVLPVILLLTACGSLPTSDGNVVGLEIRVPTSLNLTVPDTLLLQARALDINGDSVAAPVFWRTPDTTFVSLDSVTGRVVARAAGSARIQARTGTLVSDIIFLTIHADTSTTAGARQPQ